MRRVKSHLISQMNNNTLNHCMRISMEGSPIEQFNFDTSLDMWSKYGVHKQRLIIDILLYL